MHLLYSGQYFSFAGQDGILVRLFCLFIIDMMVFGADKTTGHIASSISHCRAFWMIIPHAVSVHVSSAHFAFVLIHLYKTKCDFHNVKYDNTSD